MSKPEILLEPFSPEFAQNPYAVYKNLRSSDVPVYHKELDCQLLSRYADVDALAKNSKMHRSLESIMSPSDISEQQRKENFHDMPNHERLVQLSMLEQDGESHRRLRLLVLREFSKSFIAKHRDMIQGYVNTLLDKLLDNLSGGESFDFIEDLAAQVPGHIIGNILGVPEQDCAQLRIWSENIVQYFDANRTEENKHKAETATAEFDLYLRSLIAERSKTAKDDLLSTLIQAKNAGELSETELVSLSLLILAAGHGSTIDVLGTGMLALINYPEQLALLRENPNLMDSAVQEMFRYDSPLPFFHRYASEDTEVMGQRFPKGTKFGLLYGSANHDPEQFSDADRFIIDRSPNRHLAFGRGAHLCMGNNLARLDMEIIFTELLKRVESFELVNDKQAFKKGLSVRGLSSLPLRVKT